MSTMSSTLDLTDDAIRKMKIGQYLRIVWDPHKAKSIYRVTKIHLKETRIELEMVRWWHWIPFYVGRFYDRVRSWALFR